MALNPNTSSGISANLMTYLNKVFLSTLRSNLVFHQFGKKVKLPRHSGSSMNWRRWTDLAAQTTALTEGVSPNGLSLTTNSVSATLSQYGGFVTVTDYLAMTHINEIMKEAMDLIGYNAALTVDTVVRNVLDAISGGFTVIYADGTETGGTNSSEANVTTGSDQMRSNEIRAVTESMRAGDVPPYDDGLYVGIISPYHEGNLLAESAASTAFEVLKYTDPQPMIKGLIGSMFGVRLHRSSQIRTPVEASVYRAVFCGKDAYGVVDIDGGSTQTIVHPTGTAGVEDPLNQRATIGWKTTFATAILQGARGRVVPAFGS